MNTPQQAIMSVAMLWGSWMKLPPYLAVCQKLLPCWKNCRNQQVPAPQLLQFSGGVTRMVPVHSPCYHHHGLYAEPSQGRWLGKPRQVKWECECEQHLGAERWKDADNKSINPVELKCVI